MSYSGAGIFADDFASDIRSQFREHIGAGKDALEATAALTEEHAEFLEKFPDELPVFWLALASAQWRAGRLIESVKQEALNIIDAGGDLDRFPPNLAKKRKRVLSDLRDKLTSPQPTAHPIRKRVRHYTMLDIGDLLSYRLRSGQCAILRVVGHAGFGEDRHAVFEVLDWIGEELPATDVLLTLSPKRPNKKEFGFGISNFSFPEPGRRKRGYDRLQHLRVRLEAATKPVLPFALVYWENLDGHLERDFGLI